MDINGIMDFIKEIGPAAVTLTGAGLSVIKTMHAFRNLVNSKPLLRKAIKADLDLLKLMNENDPARKLLTDHIKKRVEALIREDEKEEIFTWNWHQIVTWNWRQIAIGLSMAGGSGYWTYYIIKNQDTSNWWMILSVYIALAGLGFLVTAFEKPGGRQVVITGAINKTYTPAEISAVKINDRIGISVREGIPCGAELRFPIDMQPGTHPIGEYMSVPVADVIAQYSPDYGKDGHYLSAQGTLKLTRPGGKYSGEFEFTARHNSDQSKTIKVSGSFSDTALP